jgi:hypothetical protein
MSVTSGLSDIASFVASIAEILSLVYLIAAWADYGIPGLIGYLVGWDIISLVFDAVGRRIPSPLRILWKILRSTIEIAI